MEFDTKTSFISNNEKNSLAYSSARDRWPIILTGAIDDVYKEVSETLDQTKSVEGKQIITELAKLKYELQHDRALTDLPDDGQQDISDYNDQLKVLEYPTWFNAPWLFSECYLYRRIATLFSLSEYWKGYDVFARKKVSTFRSSRPAVLELAIHYQELTAQIQRKDSKTKEELEDFEKKMFLEMGEICLWGNATDLSLLTVLTYDEIQKIQGSKARESSREKILANDLLAAYKFLKDAKEAGKEQIQVDIILDNAGFELFVDLVLAGFLLSAGLANHIILHPKSIPWFVSDVMPSDLVTLLNILADPQNFYSAPSDNEKTSSMAPELLNPKEIDALSYVFKEWSNFHENGQLTLRSNWFWTSGRSYWHLPEKVPELYSDLKKSDLVIFKGDLNYRKLTGDAWWDPTTPFAKTLGPLGPGSGINILALRTCKSDVIAGLKNGIDEMLRDQEDVNDREARKWAWTGKWAVMSFSQGK